MYHKLAGMTGTAETEASEFWSIYKLDVVVIPTNRKVIRDDRQDLVYKTKREKYNAVIEEIVKLVEQGRPVLVGTTSVEISELLSRMLKLRGIKHNVLNAKQHQLEAQIVAEAGRSGQVTIATNMAGRGTDIKLTPEVKQAGGLAIIGTERHESRRVDRQLRGRAGRQGDPGSSQFFVSLEDDLMRLFGSGRIASMMDRMGLKEGEVIQAGLMTKAIERAQKKVEENNFGIRKRLLEYDDVMNSQREVIYTRRRHALYGERIEIDLNNIMYDFATTFVENHEGVEFDDFRIEMIREAAIQPSFDEAAYEKAKPRELIELIVADLQAAYTRRMKGDRRYGTPVMERVYEDRKGQLDTNIYFPITDGHLGYNVPVNLQRCKDSDGEEIFKVFSKVVMFTTIDDAWREHLREMDDLRQSVQNATYEQKDPLLIYKLESFQLFSKMLNKVNADVLSTLNKAYIPVRENTAENVQRERQERAKVDVNKLQASRMQAAAQAGQAEKQKPMPVHVEKKAGRNDPCPCGSGKKYQETVTAKVYNRKTDRRWLQGRETTPATTMRYLRMARIWAENSYCVRRKVGALIVKDKMIISDGYNGTPAGFENICEDETGKTKSYVLHAEANAITKVAKSANNCDGSTLYITAAPCIECSKLIIQAGIRRVVYSDDYRSEEGLDLLRRVGIECVQIPGEE